MKSALVLFVLQIVLMQNAYSQCISAPYSTYVSPSPIIAQPSVAASLADTLSLLTVSSLLAETLPLNPDVYALSYAPSCAPSYAPSYVPSYAPSCGCGCNNLGYNGYYNGLNYYY